MIYKKDVNNIYKESSVLFMCIKNAKDYGIEKKLLMEIINDIYAETNIEKNADLQAERKNDD